MQESPAFLTFVMIAMIVLEGLDHHVDLSKDPYLSTFIIPLYSIGSFIICYM